MLGHHKSARISGYLFPVKTNMMLVSVKPHFYNYAHSTPKGFHSKQAKKILTDQKLTYDAQANEGYCHVKDTN